MATLEEALADREARHIISFSGGKDSTALAIYMLEHYRDILSFEFVFCDTGVELPETYAYIRRFEELFGVTIKKIDALQMYGIREKQGRTPFDFVLNERYSSFLPSPSARWCTRELKIKPFEWYVGNDTAYTYIGIRAEEQREGYKAKSSQGKPVVISEKPNIIPVYPFKELWMDLEDIKQILKNSGLDLPPYYEWRTRSGCFFCFYQQIGEWQGLREKHPELFKRAKEYEKIENGVPYTWMQGRPLEKIESLKKRYEVPKGEDLDGCAICHL